MQKKQRTSIKAPRKLTHRGRAFLLLEEPLSYHIPSRAPVIARALAPSRTPHRSITRNIGTDPCKFTLTPRGIAGHPRRERRRVNSALVRLRNERRRIELQPSPIVGADVASLVDRRDGAADRLPRVGDAVRLGDDVHQSCELEDPSKKASWARGVAGRIKTAGGGLTSHLAPPGPFSSVFMETKTRTTTGRLSVRPALVRGNQQGRPRSARGASNA